VREAIKTLERELRDESVSRKTAERQIVLLYDFVFFLFLFSLLIEFYRYDTVDALCTRIASLEKRVEELESGCDDPNCKHYKTAGGRGGGGGGDTADGLKPVNITPPSTPPTPHHHHHHGNNPIPPPTPPTPLIQRLNTPLHIGTPRHQQRISAGLVPALSSPTHTPISPPSFPTPGSPKSALSPTPGGGPVVRAFSTSNLHQLLNEKL
jgi:hypothetical protein